MLRHRTLPGKGKRQYRGSAAAASQLGSFDEMQVWMATWFRDAFPGRSGGILLPCTAGWRLLTLPSGDAESWPADKPAIDWLRRLSETPPIRLEDRAALTAFAVGGQDIWAFPLRGRSESFLGAVFLNWPVVQSLPVQTIEVVREQANLAALAAERQMLIDKLCAASQDLAVLDRMKSDFLGTMSHELKTPLTSILGFIDLAISAPGGDSSRLSLFLEGIRDSANQLDRMVGELLVLSGMSSSAVEMETGAHSLPELVDGFRDNCQALEESSGRVSIQEPVPDLQVHVDRSRFHRVLEHLVENGLKFSGVSSNVEVKWQTMPGRRKGDPSRFLRVDVSDRGSGIAEQEQERIFQRFYQVDNSSTREQGGSGIGLALAREYVEAMGGRLWVRSVPGLGSTFSFTVPAPLEGQSNPA